MTWVSRIMVGLCCLAAQSGALAQTAPAEQGWAPPPTTAAPVYALPSLPEAPPPQVGSVAAPAPGFSPSPSVSFYDARGLAPGQIAATVGAGFPLMQIEAGLGLAPRLSVIGSVGAFLYYGQLWQPGLALKVNLYDNPRRASVALRLGGSYTFFSIGEIPEDHGPRWVTGERNVAASAQLAVSFDGVNNLRCSVTAGVESTLDLTPRPPAPLTPAPNYSIGYNIPFRIGFEVRSSRNLSLLGALGFDIHTRSDDSDVMPFILLGLTFGTPSTS